MLKILILSLFFSNILTTYKPADRILNHLEITNSTPGSPSYFSNGIVDMDNNVFATGFINHNTKAAVLFH